MMLAPPPVQLTSPQPHHEALDDHELIEGHQIIERLRGEQEALEREVLFHADRADALEDALGAAQRQNGGLAVLAHLRLHSRRQLQGALRLRTLLACRAALAATRALGAWRERAALLVVPPGLSGAPIDALERAALARERDELRGRIAVLEYNSLVHEKAARAAATKAQRLQAAAALTGVLLTRRGEGVARAFGAWEKLLS